MKNYLVTGAAGFIGATLAKKLIADGNKVTTIDNLSTGYVSNIPDGCRFIEGHAHDPEVIKKLEGECFDAIYHLAGQSGGIASYDDPIYDLDSNVASTLLLLKHAKDSGCKKFIYASSMSVYGDENECPVIESSQIKPKSFYAVGKLASEHYLRIYTQFGIKTTALRLNNIYGPGQNLDNLKQGMVSIFVAQAVHSGSIHVMGSKDRFRDFVYVDDVVNAFIAAENGSETDPFNVYNIATNIKTTVGELVAEIQKNISREVAVVYEGVTPGDQFGIFCSYDLIRERLGWEPVIKLKDGIKTMLEWAQK